MRSFLRCVFLGALPWVLSMTSNPLHAQSRVARGTDVPFQEAFALSADREATLDALLPGTAESYYYRCLHLQNEGRAQEAVPLIEEWRKEIGRGRLLQEIEHRQALLNFDGDREAALEFLKRQLGLRFDHQPNSRDAARDLESRLNPKAIGYDAFLRQALGPGVSDLAGITDYGITRLASNRMNREQRRWLLKRLVRPDLPELVEIVVADLTDRDAPSFGAYRIHGELTLQQLRDVALRVPSVRDTNDWVNAVLHRLSPSDDEDPDRDKAVELANLEALEEFVVGLPNRHNSLKAHVLYHRLAFDLARGVHDERRFQAYLALPRKGGWAHPRRWRSFDAAERVNLSASYPIGYDEIGGDAKLVRAYLDIFLADRSSPEAYFEWIDDDYLRRIFAEMKVTGSDQNRERWVKDLGGPAAFERLRDRVEIEFAPTQPKHFGADDPVAISLRLKNVGTLLMKTFEIDPLNYFRATGGEVDASINLDGLVANVERTFQGDDDALLRYEQTFEFPELAQPGTYVVEFVGNGLSSRAVITKGALTALERIGSAGHVFRVFDEDGLAVPNAVMHLETRAFRADQRGEIVVPFASDEVSRNALLVADGIASIHRFRHSRESVSLELSAVLEREELLPLGRAKLLLRPTLWVAGADASLALLEEPVLRLVATDVRGVETSVEVRELALTSSGELVHEFSVPNDLVRLETSLSGSYRRANDDGQPTTLNARARTFELNGIKSTQDTFTPLLVPSKSGWNIGLLGQNGEPVTGRALNLEFFHREFTRPQRLQLKSDERGRIELGTLPDIVSITYTGAPPGRGSWSLETDTRTRRTAVQSVVGGVVELPLVGPGVELSRREFALFETVGGYNLADRFENLRMGDGVLQIVGLPAGDFEFFDKRTGGKVRITVAAELVEPGLARGGSRLVRIPAAPLVVKSIATDADDVVIDLANASQSTRVHVFATRAFPTYDGYSRLATRSPWTEYSVFRPLTESTYHSGREIGDEYRYILARRDLPRFPGLMLPRPGVLLNPWALEEINDVIGVGGGAGGRFGGRAGGKKRKRASGGPSRGQDKMASPSVFGTLDFLGEPGVVLTNLRPDENGQVRVPSSELGRGACIRVLAVDRDDTVQRTLFREEGDLSLVDQRLTDALAPESHAIEMRTIEFVRAGENVSVTADVGTQAQTFDTLGKVYQLFRTLSDDGELARFSFLLDWPGLDREAKLALYSEHACHELHFFLFAKDRAFFDAEVRPYLANKFDKTFLDDWLLERDLTAYLEPRAFAQLNVVEQILLARRLGGDSVGRFIADRVELAPPDPEGDAARFDRVIVGDALADAEGLRESLKELAVLERGRAESRRAFKAPASGGGGGGPVMGRGPTGPGAPVENAAGSDSFFLGMVAKDEAAPKPQGPSTPGPVRSIAGLELESAGAFAEDAEEDALAVDLDMDRRVEQRQLYRPPSATKAWVESNYWRLRIEQQNGELIRANRFWRDFALAPAGVPFASRSFAEATGSFAEMVLALSVLDLPFEAGDHEITSNAGEIRMLAASPLLVAQKEIATVEPQLDGAVLVGEQFVDPNDRWEVVDGQQREKSVRGEFVAGVPYACRVVVTNPTSAPTSLEVLVQIPAGSMPLSGGRRTRTVSLRLDAFGTETFEYGFYFPEPGKFGHFPAHASRRGDLVAFAQPATLDVVAERTDIDTTSWNYLADLGTNEEVLSFLARENVQRHDLGRMAWRLKDRAFFEAAVRTLDERHVYHGWTWSYGFLHDDRVRMRQFLEHADSYLAQCGPVLECELVTIDPVERRTFQEVEFSPLIHARAHPFADGPRIVHRGLARQVGRLFNVLAHKPTLDDDDWLSVTTTMLASDRYSDALQAFENVKREAVDAQLQYDYVDAVLAMLQSDVARARTIAAVHAEHQVDRWRSRFTTVLNQIDEATGGQFDPDRSNAAENLVATEPVLELQLEDGEVRVLHENLEGCELAFYQTDVEFLFSSRPFDSNEAGGVSFVRPNQSQSLEFNSSRGVTLVNLPAELANSNLVIEVRSGGIVRRRSRFANDIDLDVMESRGQIRASNDGQPLVAAYVKVYARLADGRTEFHKDGYTDLRGRFDYVSLTGDTKAGIDRLSLLVLDPVHGAVVREIKPPLQ